MARSTIPNLPKLIQSKLSKTGTTRGADDDEIFQNRVSRSNTVIIPYPYYDFCHTAPDNNGVYEKGFIVLIKPERYFENADVRLEFANKGLELGRNALLFYETREQWDKYNPDSLGLDFATSRTNPLGGQYIARVPALTSSAKITRGFNTTSLKGVGIRVYEYASANIIRQCKTQLEYLYWKCEDAEETTAQIGMPISSITRRKEIITEAARLEGLADNTRLLENRIINSQGNTICPLCLEPLSAIGFYNKLEQAAGRDVPDLTVTQLNLFHIKELRTGEYNHKPYNLGWGHHHCNTVAKDSGITETLQWMAQVLERNENGGFYFR